MTLIDKWLEGCDFKTIFNFLEENGKNDENMRGLYSLFGKKNIALIERKNKTVEFLNEVVSFFSKDFLNEQEKNDIIKDVSGDLFLKALANKQYDIATFLNQYREDKNIYQNRGFITEELNNTTTLEKLFELSTNIQYNSSEVLTFLYQAGCRDFIFFNSLIEKFNLDINGINDVFQNNSNTGNFSHLVTLSTGTSSNIFFNNFINNYGSKIDYDIPVKSRYEKKEWNLISLLDSCNKLEDSEKLNRLSTILTTEQLSEKYVSQIANIILNKDVSSNFFDNKIYDKLFAHPKFNSDLFDREAVIFQILQHDNTISFDSVRRKNNNTINPTTVLLDKFFKNTKNINIKDCHPFIFWIKTVGTSYYSKDTLSYLIKHYKEEIPNLNFSKIKIADTIIKEINKNGINIPIKKGFFSNWFGSESSGINTNAQIETKEKTEEYKNNNNNLFNEKLINQVKDEEIKKYIESIILNAEQFNVLSSNIDYDSQHYIQTLLPKFLNKTIENYLYFLTIDNSIESKDCTLVQLKLLNKKTFDYLNKSLENEKEILNTNVKVQKSIIKNY